jgi:hypothetical protein
METVNLYIRVIKKLQELTELNGYEYVTYMTYFETYPFNDDKYKDYNKESIQNICSCFRQTNNLYYIKLFASNMLNDRNNIEAIQFCESLLDKPYDNKILHKIISLLFQIDFQLF